MSEKKNKDIMILFKLYDFTTEIVGRYDQKNDWCYVERADGTRYKYTFGVTWKKELEVKK